MKLDKKGMLRAIELEKMERIDLDCYAAGLEAEIDRLKEDLRNLEAQIDLLKAARNELQDRLHARDATIEELDKKLQIALVGCTPRLWIST